MIRIINLERRTDRKEYMRQLLDKEGIAEGIGYTFVQAVDGRELRNTEELRARFVYHLPRGFLGCALSHIGIWKQLAEDTANEWYTVLEDDISVCDDFANKLELYQRVAEKNEECDILFLGFTLNGNYEDRFKVSSHPCEPLSWKYSGGTFGYILKKCGANKLLDHMSAHGVHHPIDHSIAFTPNMRMWNAQPHIVYSDSTLMNPAKDSDVQCDLSPLLLPE